MFRPLLAGVAVAVALPVIAAQPISGRWLTADRDAVIAIGPCGAVLCGRIAKLNRLPPSGPPIDARNPDPALRSRPLAGLTILAGLKPDGDGWTGQIYDPKSGKTYRAIVTRSGGNLKVQGCVAVFCRTMTWTAAP